MSECKDCQQYSERACAEKKAANHWFEEANREHNENVRLRSALENLYAFCPPASFSPSTTLRPDYDKAIEGARAALQTSMSRQVTQDGGVLGANGVPSGTPAGFETPAPPTKQAQQAVTQASPASPREGNVDSGEVKAGEFASAADRWTEPDEFGGRSISVDQGNYGHRARKRTWLYAVGIDFSIPIILTPTPPKRYLHLPPEKRARAVKTGECQRMSHRQRKITPEPFRELLLSLAKSTQSEPGSAE